MRTMRESAMLGLSMPRVAVKLQSANALGADGENHIAIVGQLATREVPYFKLGFAKNNES